MISIDVFMEIKLIKKIISNYLCDSGLLDLPDYVTSSPQFKNQVRAWNRNKKQAMADLISSCIVGERNHKKSSCYSISIGDKINFMKRTVLDGANLVSFDFYNDIIKIFYLKEDAVHGAYTNGYEFNSFFLLDLEKHFNFKRDYSFLDLTKEKEPDHVYTTQVEVSQSGIQEALNSNEFSIREKLYMWAISEAAHKQEGVLKQYYSKSDSGRLYTKGAFGFQSLSKAMRGFVLKGYQCFDMCTAAYSILLSKCKDRSKYPTIYAYTQKRTHYREQIAMETGADVEHVKTCITALGFGSSLSVSKNAKYTTKVDVPDRFIKKIKSHDFVVKFQKELKNLRVEITDKHLLPHEKEKLEEIKSENRKYRGKFIAWYYQQYEIEALRAMQSVTEQPDNCLLLHDGLYTKTQKNPADFEDAISKQTGLSIKIDLE